MLKRPVVLVVVVVSGWVLNPAGLGDSVVVFNEIMVHLADHGSALEWVELHNQLALDVDLSGWALAGGIDFLFPEGTVLPAESYLVVAASPLVFFLHTGVLDALGPFWGQLSNSGETLTLLSNSGRVMDRVKYKDQDPWPVAPDGSGVSLAKRHEDLAAGDPANWTWSEQVQGTPGRENFPNHGPDRPLVFNEIQPGDAAPFWCEILNVSERPLILSGTVLTCAGDQEGACVLPDGVLAPHAFLVLDGESLGFTPKAGDRLFLYAPDRLSVEAAALIPDRHQGRVPDGDGPWLGPMDPTPMAPNRATLHDEIVIHEILYHVSPNRPDPSEPAPTWVELFNRGDHGVDLTGWRLADGIEFAFEPNTALAPGAYLVVASDADALRAQYPDIRIVGDFGGRLSHKDDRLVLLDGRGLPADEVHYYDQGTWPSYADGGGSSLELRDPRADNACAQAWAASHEAGKSAWTRVTYRGVAAPYAGSNTPTLWNEFVLGLLDAGELLIDDVRVTESPEGASLDLIQNGTFESGMTSWRLLGNHGFGAVIPDPEDPANPVLYLKATGASSHNHNHVETTLAGNRPIVNGRTYEVSFRARWMAGSNQLNTRLYFNRLARTTLLPMPSRPGTPGAPNSQARGNIGPTYTDLRHSPAVPEANQDVTVTCQLGDPDGLLGAHLWYAVDGGVFKDVPMQTAGQGTVTGTLPGQGAGAVVQFYVASCDRLGYQAYAPAEGQGSRALFQVRDDNAAEGPSHHVRVLMTPEDARHMHEEINQLSNHRLGATVIYKERDVYYDVKVRLKGSGYGRQDLRAGFNIRFGPDRPFQGVHDVISLDRNLADSGRHRDLVFKHIGNRAGGLPGLYDDMALLIAPFHTMDGPAQIFLARYDEEYLDSVYIDGSDMPLFELEIIYYSDRTVDGNPESLKRRPNKVLDTDFGDMGPDKEAYRWNYLIKTHRAEDDYSDLMAMAQAFSLTGDAFVSRIGQVIDVDQWMRLFAYQSLCAVGDTYNQSHTHNLKLYVRPDDHRIEALPWDTDRAFSSSATGSIYGSSGSQLQKVLTVPAHKRQFQGHLWDLLATTYRIDTLSPWITYYAQQSGMDASNAIRSLIEQRRAYVLEQLPQPVPFKVLSREPGLDQTIVLQGQAWIDVHEIRLKGRADPLDLTWVDTTHWKATVTLGPGEQGGEVEAYDRYERGVGTDGF